MGESEALVYEALMLTKENPFALLRKAIIGSAAEEKEEF